MSVYTRGIARVIFWFVALIAVNVAAGFAHASWPWWSFAVLSFSSGVMFGSSMARLARLRLTQKSRISLLPCVHNVPNFGPQCEICDTEAEDRG